MDDQDQKDGSQLARRLDRAMKAGAQASVAVVFVSAGGSSFGVVCAWPTSAMARLAQPRERAELAVLIETALPGWLWTISSAPSEADPKRWSQADFTLYPMGGRADGSMVGKAIKGPDAPLAKAMALMDEFLGAPSWRSRYEGLFDPADLARSAGAEARPPGWHLGGSLSREQFTEAMEARALAIELSSEISAPSPAPGSKPRI